MCLQILRCMGKPKDLEATMLGMKVRLPLLHCTPYATLAAAADRKQALCERPMTRVLLQGRLA